MPTEDELLLRLRALPRETSLDPREVDRMVNRLRRDTPYLKTRPVRSWVARAAAAVFMFAVGALSGAIYMRHSLSQSPTGQSVQIAAAENDAVVVVRPLIWF
jgi:hypothetical protein